MAGMNQEALKRRKIADRVIKSSNAISLTDAVFIAGSVAYGPKTAVTKDSDVDLVMIAQNPTKIIGNFIGDQIYKDILKYRTFDGLTLKYEKEDVPVSLHILSQSALSVIANSFIADIRLLRKGGKQSKDGSDPIYMLNSFGEVPPYPYKITNVPIPEAEGFYRTIVPVQFFHKTTDRTHMGIHRDKLMSNPLVLHDRHDVLDDCVDKVWKAVTQHLYNDSMRHMGRLDLTRLNIPNALNKYHRFDPEVKDDIHEKESAYLTRFLR